MPNFTQNQPAFATLANNIPCQTTPVGHPVTGNYTQPQGVIIKAEKDSQRYGITVKFTNPNLSGLKGNVTIDPNCTNNIIEIDGELTGFNNLSNIRIIPTSTAVVTSTSVVTAGGSSEYQLRVAVPVKVNGVVATPPAFTNSLDAGWNFRTATIDELPANNVPVTFFAGTGSTAGSIVGGVDLNSITISNAQIPLAVNTTSGNGSTGTVNYLSTGPLSLISNSSAISIISNDASNSVTFGLLLSSALGYNDLRLDGTRGLVSYHIPKFADTDTNNDITILDSTSPFTLLDVGSIAYWKNNDFNIPVAVRKINSTGSNQWISLGTSLQEQSSSTLSLTLSPTNILTGRVPLRIASGAGTPAALSIPSATAVGYVIRANAPLTIADGGNGELQLGINTTSLFTFTDSATVDFTEPTPGVFTASSRLRANGTSVAEPSGASPVGYDLRTNATTLLTIAPGATPGTVEFGDKLFFQSNNSVTFSRVNTPTASTVTAFTRKGYNTSRIDTLVTGNVSIVSTGADCISLIPSGNLSANRIFTLVSNSAVEGDLVTISTVSLEPASVVSFEYIVNSDSGFLSILANQNSLSPNSQYTYLYTQISTGVFEWRRIS